MHGIVYKEVYQNNISRLEFIQKVVEELTNQTSLVADLPAAAENIDENEEDDQQRKHKTCRV